MSTEKKLVVIGKFVKKNKTVNGEQAKTISLLWDNGVIMIDRLLLSNDEVKEGYTLIGRKFGKGLFHTNISFKFSTLVSILQSAADIIKEEGIKPQDTL